jgi:hypothetical protein
MKRFISISRTCLAFVIATTFTLCINHANAEILLVESFETPVNPSGGTDPTGWSAPGHPGYFGVANEANGNWSTPYGEQGIVTYSNGVATKTVGFLPSESGNFIVKFNITSSRAIGEYKAELTATHPFFGPSSLRTVTGDTDGSKDMSYSDQITWRYDYDAEDDFNLSGAELEIKLGQDPDRSNWRHTPIWDNVIVEFIPDVDSSGPKVIDMVNNEGRVSVVTNTLLTYTVTFDEDIDGSTLNTADFENNGSSAITIGSITETSPTSGVFIVEVTPTTDGTLRLRISSSATIDDTVGNSLETVPAIIDDVTINVEGTLPLLDPLDIVDDQGGSNINPNTLVTYTLTFSKDMDHTTVTASDFVNAGTAPVTIGTVTETATPGVFTVEATPTGDGSLLLSVKAEESLRDTAGNYLDTSSAIVDDTSINVDGTAPTLDEIVDDKGGSSIAANTVVNYSVIFTEDMDETTVTAADFSNAGTAPIIINSVAEATPGVFSVEVIPTGSGSLQLRINSGENLDDAVGNSLDTSSAILDDTIITVTAPLSPYDAWASGSNFGDDDNGDGVDNGLAWMLGATDASENALNLLPEASMNGGNLRLTFRCLKVAGRGAVELKVQHSNDMGQTDLWSGNAADVPDTDSTVNGIIFDTTDAGDYIDVIVDIPAASADKIFGRLNVSGP